MSVLAAKPIDLIKNEGLIAIIRGQETDVCLHIAETLLRAGVRVLEVAIKSKNDFATIKKLKDRFGDEILLGAGTVISIKYADMAIEAGSSFLLAPDFNPEVFRHATAKGILHIPGAFTPSEIQSARNLGAQLVKFFPAENQLPFFKNLRGPLGTKDLMPVGGIDLKNIPQFQSAGARIFGIGSSLVPSSVEWDQKQLQLLKSRAAMYLSLIKSNII